MDDLESLFRVRGARGAAPAAGEAPTHVLFGADDQDLLGDELPPVASSSGARRGGGGSGKDTDSIFSFDSSLSRADTLGKPQYDDWVDYDDEVQLRPMGSSKVIEADDDEDLLAEPRAPEPRRGGPQRGRERRLPKRAQSAVPGAQMTLLGLLLDDAKGQLYSLRRRFWRRLRELRGLQPAGTTRTIMLNDAEANAQDAAFSTNQVMTNKYNLITFVPLFLGEQFSKYANLFFLFIGCLQQIPGVSPTNRWTTLVPLAIVLLVGAFAEVTEDWKRYTADVEMNARLVQVLDPATHTWVDRPWRSVCVGDIVRVERNAFFPADLVLLSSSEPEGLAYVETANLDGETNLKVKQASGATAALTSAAAVASLRGQLACETPNNSLYTFEGALTLAGRAPLPIGPDQLLLRGSQLRNAPWVFGLVVFTGMDTKLMQNTTGTPMKRTRVEHQVNWLILSLFALLLGMAVISAIGAQIFASAEAASALYLMPELDTRSGVRQFVEAIITYIILYNSLIPISLIVSMDLVRFQLAALIHSDLDMYYEPTDTPAECRRPNLVEDLGQVQYLFSDKTGTLTRNEMEFQQASIAGVAFATPATAAPDGERHAWADVEQLAAPLADHVDAFLTLLAVCHTVIPERDGDRVVFQASSPDEAALVAGAERLGYRFTTRTPRSVFIDVRGAVREYAILQVCEFNSARKRMSTVVRTPDGRLMLLCKGADTVILPRLAPQQACLDATLAHLEAYAGDGLRTLCIAARELSAEEHRTWAAMYDAAAASLDGRGAALDAAAEAIERDLTLLGATAIEDKLQDGVPETIATLQTAGIRVWVLTGDRLETAINIGYSCRLIAESMSLLVVNEATPSETATAIEQQLATLDAQPETSSDELALVVEGRSLAHVLEPPLAASFLRLAAACKAVVCCRVSPLQKALVVELVKAHTDAVLLAIGDGANDVGMIQAAHVGVGISGHEGLQAARSADVALAQFRYLRKLLLVHGNWSYTRLSKMILYSFYKTVTLYLTLFWFSFYNRFSGQTAYESWTQSFYNVVFTIMPTLVIGIFDQYLSAVMLERYPQLYRPRFLTGQAIAEWMANAVYHSIVNFFLVSYVFYNATVRSSGEPTYQWLWGTTLFFTVLVTVLGKAAVMMNLWTRYTVMAIPGSLGITLVFFVVFASVAPMLGVSVE